MATEITPRKKVSQSETGIAKNIEAMEKLIEAYTQMGSSYQPPQNDLSIASLTAAYTAAKNAGENVRNTEPAYHAAVRGHDSAMKNIKKFVPRVRKAAQASGVPAKDFAAITALLSRITGSKEKGKKSTSRLSYGMLVEHLRDLSAALLVAKNYAAKPGMRPEDVRALADALDTKNGAVTRNAVAFSKARSARNIAVYDVTGVTALGNRSKAYIYSEFGASSAEYKAIKGIVFTTRKFKKDEVTMIAAEAGVEEKVPEPAK